MYIIEAQLSSFLYTGCGASIRPKGLMQWMSAVTPILLRDIQLTHVQRSEVLTKFFTLNEANTLVARTFLVLSQQ
jgi:hypothetical protein